jgi:hypothetical protein
MYLLNPSVFYKETALGDNDRQDDNRPCVRVGFISEGLSIYAPVTPIEGIENLYEYDITDVFVQHDYFMETISG